MKASFQCKLSLGALSHFAMDLSLSPKFHSFAKTINELTKNIKIKHRKSL